MTEPNILLLCPDEMKASALGCYGQTQPTSPFLDQIAQRGAQFNQCHVVHTKCVPSRASLLTAQYPHVNGHRTLALEVRPHEINLIRQLKDHGYETALAGKNHTVDAQTMPQTFDHHLKGGGRGTMEGDGQMPPGSYYVGQDDVPYESFKDTRQTDEAINWLNQRSDQKPFFMWLNWGSPHPPYSVPAPCFGTLDRASIKLPPRDLGVNKPPYQKMLY
ncbi:MAG: sulfatase-like hydrolase/transferase, partial [Phycisphaeraceae bacterium]|nr:sulfatase-like hydrolase/transferase [Phycisphaeraceae bacterium]